MTIILFKAIPQVFIHQLITSHLQITVSKVSPFVTKLSFDNLTITARHLLILQLFVYVGILNDCYHLSILLLLTCLDKLLL